LGRTGPGVPRSRLATELLLSGRTFLTDEAASFGLIHRIAPDGQAGRRGSRRRTELSRFDALLPGLDALLGRGVG
jgi:enoyl-CoA hydratase/carnithine racemase